MSDTGHAELRLRLDSIEELFVAPAFRLDRTSWPVMSGIERAVAELRSAPSSIAPRLVVQIAGPISAQEVVQARTALRGFCAERAADLRVSARATRRSGWFALSIAAGLMALALTLAALIEHLEPLPRLLNHLFTDGLVIVGWVLLWRPLDMLLFDSAAPLRLARIHERLASAELIVATGSGDLRHDSERVD